MPRCGSDAGENGAYSPWGRASGGRCQDRCRIVSPRRRYLLPLTTTEHDDLDPQLR